MSCRVIGIYNSGCLPVYMRECGAARDGGTFSFINISIQENAKKFREREETERCVQPVYIIENRCGGCFDVVDHGEVRGQ